ncbi:MAG: chromosomal replication initiator protein DnaA, partial [Chloroflexi bacterium]|nr:chromosomal replication initiator protein DnaA [Chloroflexota bacterium]
YNPLFLYGGVGLGKTHLLHAIGHKATKTGRRPLYVSSERFTNDLVNSIRGRRTEAFRQQYRNCDVLLVDDIQFLAGREGTQEEFFHTFNELHGAGKQIVISSDRPPKSIKLLEERLQSRFEWGLIADLQPPELETRTAILDAKAEGLGTSIPRPVIAFLARRIQRNVRELEGCLTRVIAFAELHHQPITVEIATSALASLTGNGRRRLLQPNQILEAVASQYQVSVPSLIGKQRHQKLALPRHVCMYLLREELDITLQEVGRVLGGRDHSTVIHGSERIAREINTDSGLRSAIAAIREILYKK